MTETMVALAPVFAEPGECRTGKALRLMGQTIETKVLSGDSNGVLSAGLVVAPPMSGPPLHVHLKEDEWFYVLEGELTVHVDGKEYQCGPGASVFAPRTIPHTFQNFTGSPVRFLVAVTPAGLEAFFEKASALADASPRAMEELMWEHGMAVLGPPLSR